MKKFVVLFALLLVSGICARRTPAQNPSFTGSFEVANCNSISGWAEDANNLNIKTVAIGDIVVEGPEVDDFVDAANPWKNAFVRGQLTRPITEPGNPRHDRTENVRRSEAMGKYPVVLAMLLLCGVLAGSTPEAIRAQSPSFTGSFEVADCTTISGWVEDANNLNTPINVNIFEGSTLVATALANLPRNDVGNHGFNIPTPAALQDTKVHTVSARAGSSTNDILNSPRSMGPCLTPRFNSAEAVRLNVDFKLQNGAASTLIGRLVDLNFTATEATGSTLRDVTGDVTAYRVKESPNLNDVSLSAEPWIPLERPLRIALAQRNGAGYRYGERKVMFQVKIATLTSNILSDTIVVEPQLKEYRVSASGGVHPLIQYAASQGFTFPLNYYETCNGDCPTSTVTAADPSLASGTAVVAAHGSSSGTCVTKADYLMFEERSPNQFWRIKSVGVADATVPGVTDATVRGHGANRFLVKINLVNKGGTCLGRQISIGDVVVEGPEVDDFVDPANPWKNAFVRVELRPITINPNPRPN